MAATFAEPGILQTLSFLVTPVIADRIGLLATLVLTHLASDASLAAIAFAPDLTTVVGLLAVRAGLSQLDVPTRQVYVMAMVDPADRTARPGGRDECGEGLPVRAEQVTGRRSSCR